MGHRKEVALISGKNNSLASAKREWTQAIRDPEIGLIVGDDRAISGAMGISLVTLDRLREAGVRMTLRPSAPDQWTWAIEPVASGGRSLLETYRNLLDTACKEQAFGQRPDQASMLQEAVANVFDQLDPGHQRSLRADNKGPEIVLRHINLD